MSKYLLWNIVNIFSGMNVSKPFQLLAHKYTELKLHRNLNRPDF